MMKELGFYYRGVGWGYEDQEARHQSPDLAPGLCA